VDSRKGSVYGFEHLLIPFSLINFNKGILYNFGVAVSCFSFLVFCEVLLVVECLPFVLSELGNCGARRDRGQLLISDFGMMPCERRRQNQVARGVLKSSPIY
jgi:hypothetical protein